MGVVLHGGCQQLNVPHSHGFGHHQHLHEISGSEGNLRHPSCVEHRSLVSLITVMYFYLSFAQSWRHAVKHFFAALFL